MNTTKKTAADKQAHEVHVLQERLATLATCTVEYAQNLTADNLVALYEAHAALDGFYRRATFVKGEAPASVTFTKEYQARYDSIMLDRAWASLADRLERSAMQGQAVYQAYEERLTKAREEGWKLVEAMSRGREVIKGAAHADVARTVKYWATLGHEFKNDDGTPKSTREKFDELFLLINSECMRLGRHQYACSSSQIDNLCDEAVRVAWFEMAEKQSYLETSWMMPSA